MAIVCDLQGVELLKRRLTTKLWRGLNAMLGSSEFILKTIKWTIKYFKKGISINFFVIVLYCSLLFICFQDNNSGSNRDRTTDSDIDLKS